MNIKIGNTKITELENNLTLEEKRLNLKIIYDVFNDIGKELFENGEDISGLFLTKEQFEKIKREHPECLI